MTEDMGTLVCVLVLLLGLYLVFRVVEAALKVLLWGVVLVAGYGLVAPMLGWPSVSDWIDPLLGGAFADWIDGGLSALREVFNIR